MSVKDKYINSDKLLFYQDRFEKAEQPISAEMILTNFCNYDCDYCRYKHGKGYINYKDFVKATQKLVGMGVRGFILTGGGEPLLNPDIEKITKFLEDEGLKYGINTNFTKIHECRPEWIKISLHKDFVDEKVLNNLKKFREWNHETVVGAQCIIKERKDIEIFYERYKDLDVDYLVFRPLELNQKFYEEKEIEEIVTELEALREKDSKITINYKWYMMDRVFDVCSGNWTVITIGWNGDVWYCCHKPFEVVGNIFTDDVIKAKKEWKSDMSKCDWPCRMTCNNIILDNYEGISHIEFI